MNYKEQKTVKNIEQIKIFTVLLLSIFALSIPTWARNTKNIELEDINLNEIAMLDTNLIKDLINENIQSQCEFNKQLSKEEIANIAFNQFVYYRNHGGIIDARFRKLINPQLNNEVINYQSYGESGLLRMNKTKEYSTKINIDSNGNFTIRLGGDDEYQNGIVIRASSAGTIIGNRRKDGYYHIFVVRMDAYPRRLGEHICDLEGNILNQQAIRQNYQSYLNKEIDRIQYLSGTNKDMIASILAGNDIYDVDYVQKDEINKIYADKLDKNIEIRFVKADTSTIYGVYIISSNDNSQAAEDNNGSEIYAFKYSDDSTSKKRRVTLMTKRVVQYDFDEQYPSTQKYTTGTKGKEERLSQEFTQKTGGLFNRKIKSNTSEQLKSIYEDFMCEGVTYKTYTKDDNGKFYQNQQEIF